MMALFRRADEIIIRRIERLRHAPELCSVAVSQFARRDSFLLGRLQHLDAVLVRTGQEEDVFAVESLEAGKGIRCEQFVGMADMRLAVRIGNRSGDVEFLTGHCGPS
jgi:hypothetical protein